MYVYVAIGCADTRRSPTRYCASAIRGRISFLSIILSEEQSK